MAVLNKSEDGAAVLSEEFEDITGLGLCSIIPFIPEKDKSFLKISGISTGILDLQKEMDSIAGKIF